METLVRAIGALACLIGVLGALALARDGSTTGAPEAVAPTVRWRTALVGITGGGRRVCEPVDASTLGVIHPVLPCGAKIVVRANGRTIRTEVIGQPGSLLRAHEFDLTPALAAQLGVEAGTRIRWRFAR